MIVTPKDGIAERMSTLIRARVIGATLLYLVNFDCLFLQGMSVHVNNLVVGYVRSGEKLLKDAYSDNRMNNVNTNILNLLPTMAINLMSNIKNDQDEPELFPSLVIFELDDCLWNIETYTLH